MRMHVALAAALILATSAVGARPGHTQPVPVTVDNFVRAETDLYFETSIATTSVCPSLMRTQVPCTIESRGETPPLDISGPSRLAT